MGRTLASAPFGDGAKDRPARALLHRGRRRPDRTPGNVESTLRGGVRAQAALDHRGGRSRGLRASRGPGVLTEAGRVFRSGAPRTRWFPMTATRQWLEVCRKQRGLATRLALIVRLTPWEARSRRR